jgi:cytoskeleton protein RodZ
MNEPDTADGEGEDKGPLAGERLAAARRQLKIPLGDVAKALHLDEHKVAALEANRFEIVGPPVFAKGHLRKYAELVGVPIEDMLADYYKLNRSVGAPPVVGPKRKYPRQFSAGPWIAGFVSLALLSSAAWWWLNREVDDRPAARPPVSVPDQPMPEEIVPEESVPEESIPEESVPQELERQAVEQPAPASIEADQDLAAASAPAEAEEDVPLEQVAPPPPSSDATVTDGTVELRMAFSGDCWTEVSDGDGRQLFFDLGVAGRTVTVAGPGPLDVLLGNADNVLLTVDGAAYDVPQSSWADNTLRLTISGQ